MWPEGHMAKVMGIGFLVTISKGTYGSVSMLPRTAPVCAAHEGMRTGRFADRSWQQGQKQETERHRRPAPGK
jgi:hypothetical protein